MQLGIEIEWDDENPGKSIKRLRQDGYTPDNWGAVRKATRAAQVPLTVYRDAWRDFHPLGQR